MDASRQVPRQDERFAKTAGVGERRFGGRVSEELPAMLLARGWSLRELARQAGVSHPNLSRALRGVEGKRVGRRLAEQLAVALGHAPDFFVEAREGRVAHAVRQDGDLREELYAVVERRYPFDRPKTTPTPPAPHQ